MSDQKTYAVLQNVSGTWYTGSGWTKDIGKALLMTRTDAERFVGHDTEAIVEMKVMVLREPWLIVNYACTCGGKDDGWHGKTCAKRRLG